MSDMSSTLFLTRKGIDKLERDRTHLERGEREMAWHHERILLSTPSEETFKDNPRIAGWVNVFTQAFGSGARVKTENHVKDLNRVIAAIGAENVVEVAPNRRGLKL